LKNSSGLFLSVLEGELPGLPISLTRSSSPVSLSSIDFITKYYITNSSNHKVSSSLLSLPLSLTSKQYQLRVLKKLHNEEIRDLYSSPSRIRIMKSRRKRWAGYEARIGRIGTRIDYWWESQRERDH
jgi:hypothetical protein